MRTHLATRPGRTSCTAIGTGMAIAVCFVVTFVTSGCFLLSPAPERPDGFGRSGADDDGDDDGDVSQEPDITGNATLFGVITRSVEPVHGGVGNLYIAVLDDNPLVSVAASVVRSTFVARADMSSPDAAIEYSLPMIPVRTEQYFVFAFLDDDGNAGVYMPTPSASDPVTIQAGHGSAVPVITLSTSGRHELDLDLNLLNP